MDRMLSSPHTVPVQRPGPTPPQRPLAPGPQVLMSGSPHSWFRFSSVLTAFVVARRGVCACVCVYALLLGTGNGAGEKQMGPLRSPLAWKMKGGENRNKKRKQLWQDRGQRQCVGWVPARRGSSLSRFRCGRLGITKNSILSMGGAHSTGQQVYPLPFRPFGPSVKWRLNSPLTN